MKANNGWGLVSSIGFCLGLASSACHDAPPTDEKVVRAAGAGGAAPVTDAHASAGSGVAGAAVAPAAPIASAVLPDGVARLTAEPISPKSLSAAVKANNEFGVALFGALRSESARINFLTSPLSASLALGMTYAGARGQTRREMARALRIHSQAVFEGQNALSQALAKRGAEALAQAQFNRGERNSALPASDFTLQIVNSLWGQASYAWKPPFLKTLAENYGAGLFSRDFKHEWDPARLEINRWVSAQTNDKIKDLLPADALDEHTRLVLVNALHLKLPWAKPFEPSQTAPGPFTPSNGKPVTVPFMHLQADFAYLDDGSAQIAALPLSAHGLCVIIALPHAGVSLPDYERSLHAGSASLTVPKASQLVALELPKVTFTSPSVSLRDALRRLGMVQAFDPLKAQFEDMATIPPQDVNLSVSDVLQKTMIAMQENGVEAAAATAVVMAVAASAQPYRKPPEPIPMIVNRPYMIAVVDQPTGAVLMLGHIETPTE